VTNPDPERKKPEQAPVEWGEQVGEKETRKIRARETRDQSIWFGFGTFGVIGWSIAVPTLAGILIGQWIDRTWPSQFSWTLMLMLAGLMTGCFSAWYWLNHETGLITRKDAKKRADPADTTKDKNGS
jgi:ATP synthase protein I